MFEKLLNIRVQMFPQQPQWKAQSFFCPETLRMIGDGKPLRDIGILTRALPYRQMWFIGSCSKSGRKATGLDKVYDDQFGKILLNEYPVVMQMRQHIYYFMGNRRSSLYLPGVLHRAAVLFLPNGMDFNLDMEDEDV